MLDQETIQTFLLLFIQLFFRFLELALIAHIILSWVSRKKSPLKKAVDAIIVPLLRPFRFMQFSGLDFSPIALYILIGLAETTITKTISAFL